MSSLVHSSVFLSKVSVKNNCLHHWPLEQVHTRIIFQFALGCLCKHHTSAGTVLQICMRTHFRAVGVYFPLPHRPCFLHYICFEIPKSLKINAVQMAARIEAWQCWKVSCASRVPEVLSGGCCYSDRGVTRFHALQQWLSGQWKVQMRSFLTSQILMFMPSLCVVIQYLQAQVEFVDLRLFFWRARRRESTSGLGTLNHLTLIHKAISFIFNSI